MTENCFSASGKDGFEVLNLAASPRQAAMAEAGGALAPDADGFVRNPAVLGWMRSPEASLSQASLPLSVSLQSLAYVHPASRGAWAGRATLLRAGNLKGYDAVGTPTGKLEVQDSVFSLGYGRKLARGGGLGISFKQVRQSIGRDAAAAWAADAGWVQPLGRGPLCFSLGARNLGGKAAFIQEETALPRSYDAGLSFRGLRGALGAALEVRRAGDGRTTGAAGLEGWAYNSLAIRAGFDSAREQGGGLSLGLGFRIGGARLDYAFLPRGAGFDPVHRFGLSVRFQSAGERAYQEGLSLSQKGEHAEAIYKFKEALDEDPSLNGAVRALRESVEALKRQTEGRDGQ